jgi:hypothetical protein
MNRLPIELTDSIVCRFIQDEIDLSNSSVCKFTSLATVSKVWRGIVERHTFRSLTLRNNKDWDTFVKYMSTVDRRRSLRSIIVERLPGQITGVSNDHWRNLARRLEIVYTELDGWGEAFAVRKLSLKFPFHPVLLKAKNLDKAILRCGIPYVDLSQYFSKDFTLPVWPSIQDVEFHGENHRISLVFFSKLANACPGLHSW